MSRASHPNSTAADRPPAVLVGVQLQGVSDEALASSLDELERLTETLGLNVIGRVTQKRRSLGDANLLGEGKLRELAGYTGGPGFVPQFVAPGSRAAREADRPAAELDPIQEDERDERDEENADQEPTPEAVTVIIDHDLSPTQMRNLEKVTGVEVLDRSMVILSIFQRHARTREAKIQVEIARLVYMAPRLRETHANVERQRGGIGGKGAGESALELGRRGARDRIAELRRTLVGVQREAETQRSRRSTNETQSVALIGYTNAGKSRLMRGLTNDSMYVADQLFATLDTTVRVLVPETRPRILISDTVGFIKDLPHDLVASFRSTLAEAKDASLHLHVVDASDPAMRNQYEVTRKVLAEIDADEHPRLLILNKCDLLDEAQRDALAAEFPEAVLMAASVPTDVLRLHGLIRDFFERFMEEETFLVPYDRQAKVGLLHERCRVLEERYEEDGAHVRVLAPAGVLDGLRREI
ncbi:MAG: GTPase HflX [Myxococcota bacterium]|jgi:GTP-binding protein HflX